MSHDAESFVHHLDGRGQGYWPDFFGDKDPNSLDVNPTMPDDPQRANLDIPWLWWGMRAKCTDMTVTNRANVGTACALTDKFYVLKAHASGISRRQNANRAKWSAAGKEVLRVCIKGLGNAAGVGIFMDAYDAISNVRTALRNSDSGPSSFQEAVDNHIESLADEATRLLISIMGGGENGGAGLPVVLILDDAQWVDQQTVIFLDQVLDASVRMNLPLMVIATHWEKEWNTFLQDARPEQPEKLSDITSPQPTLINLKIVERLDDMLRDALPGLTVVQHDEIIRKVGGNPRLLYELILALKSDSRYFINRDFTQAMKPARFRELNLKTLDLYQIFRRRFDLLDDNVKDGLAWSSAQGMSFLKGLTVEVGRRMALAERDGASERSLGDAIDEASETHAILNRRTPESMEFRQSVYFDPASGILGVEEREQVRQMALAKRDGASESSLGDAIDEASETHAILNRRTPELMEFRQSVYFDVASGILGAEEREQVRQILKEIVRETISDTERIWADRDERYLFLEFARFILADDKGRPAAADDSLMWFADDTRMWFADDTRMWFTASVALFDLLSGERNWTAALAVAKQVAHLMQHTESQLGESSDSIWDQIKLIRFLIDFKQFSPAQAWLVTLNADIDDPNSVNLFLNSQIAMLNGDVARALQDLNAARDYFQKGLDIDRKVAEKFGETPESLRDISISLGRLGHVALGLNDLNAARDYFLKALEIRREVAEKFGETPESLRDISISLGRLGDVVLALQDLNAACDYFLKALDINRKVAEKFGETPESLRDISISLGRLGDVALARQDLNAACDYFLKALDINRKVAEKSGETPESLRDISISLGRLGDVALALQDLNAARDYFQKALDINRKVAEKFGETPESLRDISISLERLGDVARALQDLDAARDYFQKALDIAVKVAEKFGETPESLRGISISFGDLGDVARALQDLDAARDYFLKALEINRKVTEKFGETPESLRGISISLVRLGYVARALKDLNAARDYFQKVLDINRQVAEKFGETPESLRVISISLGSLGDVALALKELEVARDYFQKALDIIRKVAEKFGETPESLRDISISLERLGDVALALQDLDAARDYFQKALDINRKVAEKFGETPESLRDITISFGRLGEVALALQDLNAARDYFMKALEIRREVAEKFGETPESLRDITISLGGLGGVALALRDLNAARDYFQKILDIAMKGADKFGETPESLRDISIWLVSLGDVALGLNDLNAARDYFQKARDVAQTRMSKWGESGDTSEMLEYLRQVISAIHTAASSPDKPDCQ